MPQLDSLVLFSQAQLVLYFFLGFYIFLYYVMPLIFVSISISNELYVYKYYKHKKNIDSLTHALSSRNSNSCFSLILVSNLDKYNYTKLKFFF